MATSVNIDNVWKTVSTVSTKVSTVWKTVIMGWIKVFDVWRVFFTTEGVVGVANLEGMYLGNSANSTFILLRNEYDLNSSATITGTLVNVRVRTQTSIGPFDPEGYTVKFKIFRSDGINYNFIWDSGNKTVYPGYNSFIVNQAIQGGDFLGIYFLESQLAVYSGLLTYGRAQPSWGSQIGDVMGNTTIASWTFSFYSSAISAGGIIV